MIPLKPSKLTERFLYVFFDTECKQDLESCDGSFENVPNLVCAKQMCSKCEAVDYLSADCEECSECNHVLWQDPVGEFIANSGCPKYLQITFMLFRTTLVDTTHSFYCAGFWNRDGYLK